MADDNRVPGRVIVIGAGIIGLSVAWSLQERGVEVDVLDRREEGAGSSWRNAGYISPPLTVPLPEPGILRYGIRAVLDPRSPVHVPVRADAELSRFLLGMVRHCTTGAWTKAMAVYRPLNTRIFESYDRQLAGGVRAEVATTDILAGFSTAQEADGLFHELQGVLASGLNVDIELMTARDARAYEPHLSDAVTLAVQIRGQRYIVPFAYVTALAESFRARGGKIVEGAEVSAVSRRGGKVVVSGAMGELDADAVVIASGAWMSSLACLHGVSVPVFGGRGYSFTLPVAEPLKGPLYFPSTRVAITPEHDRIRFSGVMEFERPDAPARPAGISSMVAAVRPLLADMDWDDRRDDWVGARPLTTDGLPLVGATRTPGVYVAGGHGMWGMTLGPLTGHLLAEQITTGVLPAELRPLDPCR
jgi:D-amino-acid dehydrogenase